MKTNPLTTAELKTWLETRKLEVRDLARLTGMPAWTVVRWRRGLRPCPAWLRAMLGFIDKSSALAERTCKRCNKPLPQKMRVDAKYCGDACRAREYLERKQVKSTATLAIITPTKSFVFSDRVKST